MREWLKPTRLQIYSFVYAMPVVAFLANYILYDERIFHDINVWLISYPLIILICLGFWRVHLVLGNWIKYRYPKLEQTRIRILICTLCIIPVMSVSVLLINYFYDLLHILGYEINQQDLKQGLFVGFSIILVFETLYEADYALGKYKETVEEKRVMQELSVFQEFDALKSQVNPHFLFNCFNTLSSLISEDKEKAEQFLNELSKVYRYLLRNNQNELSTVQDEVKFIESYFRLLQTRHGEAVQLNMEIDKMYTPYLLPSLTLQLLVENAVKHNALSKSRPLLIDIFTTAGNRLVVNNNLQRRSVKATGNKIGLENIRAKYDLLGQDGFHVLEDEKNFTVVLPLIWNSQSESSASKTFNAGTKNKLTPGL